MSNLKNVELATTTNITTTYAGQFAGEYIAAALLSASTIDDGGITVKSNLTSVMVDSIIAPVSISMC